MVENILARYFYRLRLAKSSWTYWRVSWVPPTKSYTADQFLLDCNAILSSFRGRFFSKRLQVPYSATVGWLFKSTDKIDQEALHEFLRLELARRGSTTPFAVYAKEPFKGSSLPDSKPPNKPPGSDWSSGYAIHIDTLEGSEVQLYQKIKAILSSSALSTYTNFRWSLFPPYHNDLPRKDKVELSKAITKQRGVATSLFSISTNVFIDPDEPVKDDISIRHFLLAQLSPAGNDKKLILGIDRDKRSPDHFILTCGRLVLHPETKTDVNAEALTFFAHFLPSYLLRYFGTAIRTHLSAEGLLCLDDQYWDDDLDSPCSRRSDSLQAAHMDESDFTIIVDCLPDSLIGAKRPSSDNILDFDDITQASFNTQGQAKVARIESPVRLPPAAARVSELETLCSQQQDQIADLQAKFTALLNRFPSGPATGGPSSSP